jgi:hypothetical protein
MKTGTRILCGIAGALLIVIAAYMVFFLAAAAFGSYYDNPATSLGVIPGPVFTIGRHLLARCFHDSGERPLAVTIGDYLGDTLIAMSLISALDGIWANDADASSAAVLLLFVATAVYVCSFLLSRPRRAPKE